MRSWDRLVLKTVGHEHVKFDSSHTFICTFYCLLYKELFLEIIVLHSFLVVFQDKLTGLLGSKPLSGGSVEPTSDKQQS